MIALVVVITLVAILLVGYLVKKLLPRAATMDSSGDMEQALMDEAKRLLVPSNTAKKDVTQAMQAFAILVAAVRLREGDQGANALLERGRLLFQELEGSDQDREMALERLTSEMSFLGEQGREGILKDALEDGSSVLCRKCSGLVKRARWDAHHTLWCPALEEGEEEG